ncbi:MAG: PDZ domain-containing protein [Phycisphaerales bacterium]|nr:MAG: PDZ domain-containing protein [Phycisphaerales bacterium]
MVRTLRYHATSPLRCLATLLTVVACAGGSIGYAQSEPGPAPQNRTDALRADMRRLIEEAKGEVYPALVHITLVSSTYYGGKEIRHRRAGSGTIITPQGHVLTNQHVTDNGRRFRCTLADKRELSAELVGEDPLTDLAVLKLDLAETGDLGPNVSVATIGDSSRLLVGDHVLAMGSPWALSRSVTSGIVSNTERVFAGWAGEHDPDEMRLAQGQRTGLYTRWIQHDAAINPGNSGGPLVNLKGEVIGVNELGRLWGGDMGFAIPGNLAKEVAEALIRDGVVARSWIGVSFKAIERTGLERGVLVDSIVQDSPADRAGIVPGDVVVALDGEALTIRYPEEIPLLLKRVADYAIGSSIAVTCERDGAVRETVVTTAKLEKDKGEELAFHGWGMTALDITPMAAREHLLDTTAGVLVSGVRSGRGAALAKPPLSKNDVVKSIETRPISDLSDFTDAYESVMASDPLPEYVLVEFERQGKIYLTLLEPKPEEDRDPPPEIAKAWVGVAVQPFLKDLAERMGPEEAAGFRITQVYPRTKAAQSDLKVGDVVTHLNDRRFKPRRPEDGGMFQREVRRLDIDDTATLTIVREGQQLKTQVVLERTRIRPDEAKRDRNRDFELTVRELTFFDRVDNRWGDDVKGVIAIHVESAGWAGLGGIRPGDLIQRIDDLEISDLASYREAMRTIDKRRPERIVFGLLRGVRTRFQYVEPEWTP